MNTEYQKGQRLFIETEDETVEGEFQSTNAKHNMITLKNCVLHPSGKALEGINRYYKNEIKSIRVLDPTPHPVKDKDSEVAGNWDLMHKSKAVTHYNKPPGKVTASDVVMNMPPGALKAKEGGKQKLTTDEYDEATRRIRSNVLIERKGKFFMDAVDLIKTEHCVGVSFEGTTLGRNNPVTLMCIATPQRAFVFDIQSMGDRAFENQLKGILQCDKIEKVIHNSRMISDCLYHKHGIALKRVFDTQVADLVITKRIQGDFPREVKSLSQCLATYLNLPENLIYQPKIHDGYIGADLAKWRQRPLPCELQMGIVKNTVFLLTLKEKLLAKMLHTFHCGVDIFLNIVKDADHEIAHDQLAKAALVPRELLTLNEEGDDAEEQVLTRNGLSNLKL